MGNCFMKYAVETRTDDEHALVEHIMQMGNKDSIFCVRLLCLGLHGHLMGYVSMYRYRSCASVVCF